MPELEIRSASVAEAPALAALVRRAYRGQESRVGWTTEADLLDGERVTVEQVAVKIAAPDGVVLALCAGAELVGCCELARRGDRLAYFGMFAVHPPLQAAGLGRHLLAAAERYARQRWGATRMEMTVIGQREELIAWYERRGYHRTGERRPFPFDELPTETALRPDLHFVVLAKPL